jgi:hypothetical protein
MISLADRCCFLWHVPMCVQCLAFVILAVVFFLFYTFG